MLLAAILSACSAISDSAAWRLSATPTFHLAMHPARESGPVFSSVAEWYSSNWRALRVDPEQFWLWEQSPGLVELALDAHRDSLRIHVVLPLRRDLMAWSVDELGSNVLTGINEVDINAPYEGWVRIRGMAGGLQAGRFRKSFSPSPHGVILGSNLVHDALWWELPVGAWNFQWFGSSLNPWLLGVDADGAVQSGSETEVQIRETVPNQRGRHFTQPWKTLFLHRLSWSHGGLELAAVEQLVVGGKAPALRDLLPFVVWHDNFGDGYSKVSTAVEVAYRQTPAGDFHWQGLVEEMRSPVGEDSGTETRVIFGANTGWSGGIRNAMGLWKGRLDVTATSPTLNHHKIPLLRGVSRRIYRSNYFDQADAGFADSWVVDQPLAYHRGPDALDVWSQWEWRAPDSGFGAHVELDLLSQGDATLQTDPFLLENRMWPLSGVVETRLRLGVGGWTQWSELELRAATELERIENADHREGDDRWNLRLHGSIGRSW
ncbi:MAG: hypothetical protein IPN71_02810 [Fibrobacteres bacterium]|nr:hypothetical protein [Fibrobacterota bacterium]